MGKSRRMPANEKIMSNILLLIEKEIVGLNVLFLIVNDLISLRVY